MPNGPQKTRTFKRKIGAQRWLDEVTASILTTGQYIDVKTARMTVAEWCDTWLAGYDSAPAHGAPGRGAHHPDQGGIRVYALTSVRPSTVRA